MQLVTLRSRIEHAFDPAPASPVKISDLLAEPYRSSDDAYELAEVLAGKAWADVPLLELFRHREMLFTLGPSAYRGYLPAYLAAVLVVDPTVEDNFGPDLRHYLIGSLIMDAKHSDARRESTRARLNALTSEQRSVTDAVIQYLKERWREDRADDALKSLAETS